MAALLRRNPFIVLIIYWSLASIRSCCSFAGSRLLKAQKKY